MNLELLAYIEFIGFCLTMIFGYYMDKGSIELGLATEEQVNSEILIAVIFAVFWFIFWPIFLIGVYKDRNNY